MTHSRKSLPGRIIDRYLVKELLRPFLFSLIVVMTALLIERMLRLIELIAVDGGLIWSMLTMVANLTPHYLGLALPAAFFMTILIVVGRLSADSEIDALLACGIPLRRLIVPFMAIALMLLAVSVALFGYIQPHARYAFRATIHNVVNGPWSGRAVGGKFVDAKDGVVFHAAWADQSGHYLSDIFIERRKPDDLIETITAREGRLTPDPEQEGRLILTLLDGLLLRSWPDNASAAEFKTLTVGEDIAFEAEKYRIRGDDPRELTINELWRPPEWRPTDFSPQLRSAELHGRLVRAASFIMLPLLALPMALASKRRRRGAGVLISSIILIAYQHILQMGQSLVELGRFSPLAGIWLPFFMISSFSFWLLWRADQRPGQGPLDSLLGGVEECFDIISRHIGRRAKRSA